MKRTIDDEAIAQIAKEILQKNKDRRDFIANHMDETMELIYSYLKRRAYINDEEMLYFPERYNFSDKHFSWVFDEIARVAHKLHKTDREYDNPFDNVVLYLRYKDLDIVCREMHGQGTSTCMWAREEKDQWFEHLVINYDEIKEVK